MSVIRITASNIHAGLFGVTLTWILEILPYLSENNMHPIWDIHTTCYGNIFPEIIQSNYKNDVPPIATYNMIQLKHEKTYTFKQSEFQKAHDLFFKFFKIPNEIKICVDDIVNKFNGKTLGLHYLGTDNMETEASHLTKEDFIQQVNVFLTLSVEYTTIFIATNEKEFINMINKNFNNTKYLLLYNKSKKSVTNAPIHKGKDKSVANKLENGKQAIINSLLLSRCDYVIKTSSCISAWAKIWNPSLEIYNINTFFYNWFPDCAIPVKKYV